jgi:hypothetical protein
MALADGLGRENKIFAHLSDVNGRLKCHIDVSG